MDKPTIEPCGDCGVRVTIGRYTARSRYGKALCNQCGTGPAPVTERSPERAPVSSRNGASIDEKIEAAVAAGIIKRSPYWRYAGGGEAA